MTKIKNRIKEIAAQVNILENNLIELIDYDKVPQIDIDLLKNKVQKIYQDIIDINKCNDSENEMHLPKNNETEVKKQLTEKKETKTDTALLPDKDGELEEIVESNEDITEKTDIQQEYEVLNTHAETEEIKEQESKKEEEVINNKNVEDNKKEELENIDLQDFFKVIKEFEKADDVASQLKYSHIDDINNAISINDRIGFVKELFGGDNERFSTCINKINNSNNLNTAIKELAKNIKLDTENNIHIKLLELVYRRFS